MVNLQNEIYKKLLRKTFSNYKDTIKVPKQLPIKNLSKQTHFDCKREIILNLDFIKAKDKNETVKNLRIQKLDNKTGEFEFTNFQGRLIFDETWYNETKGHLFCLYQNKITIFELSEDNQSLRIFQELDLPQTIDSYRLLEYLPFLEIGILKIESDYKIGILQYTDNNKYELTQILKLDSIGRDLNYDYTFCEDPVTNNLVCIDRDYCFGIYSIKGGSTQYKLSWTGSFKEAEGFQENTQSVEPIIDKNGIFITSFKSCLVFFTFNHIDKRLELINRLFYDVNMDDDYSPIVKIKHSNLIAILFSWRTLIISPTDDLGGYKIVKKLRGQIEKYNIIQNLFFYNDQILIEINNSEFIKLDIFEKLDPKNLRVVVNPFRHEGNKWMIIRYDTNKHRVYKGIYHDDRNEIEIQILSKPIKQEIFTRKDCLTLDQTLLITGDMLRDYMYDCLDLINIFYSHHKNNLTRLAVHINRKIMIFDEQENDKREFVLVAVNPFFFGLTLSDNIVQIGESMIILNVGDGCIEVIDISDVSNCDEDEISINTILSFEDNHKIDKRTGNLVVTTLGIDKPTINIYYFDKNTKTYSDPIEIYPLELIKEYPDIRDVSFSEDNKICKFILASEKDKKLSVWEFDSRDTSKELICMYRGDNDELEGKEIKLCLIPNSKYVLFFHIENSKESKNALTIYDIDRDNNKLMKVNEIAFYMQYFENCTFDWQNKLIYAESSREIVVIGDILDNNFLLDINYNSFKYENNQELKMNDKIKSINKEIISSYKSIGGITLLHFLIACNEEKLLIEYLGKIDFNEAHYDIGIDYHPLTIALMINNSKILDALAYILGKTNCLRFQEELFFKGLKSSSESFRKMISNTLFYHNKLDIQHLPNTAILDVDHMPLCFVDKDEKMTDEKLKEKIEKYLEDGEAVELKVRRSYSTANWSFQNDFINRFLIEYGKNAVKVIDNYTINLVKYLWRRYRWLAIIFSMIYFIFMVTTILTIVWCYDADSCEQFIDLGTINLAFLISIRILMLSSYLFILFLEFISFTQNGLRHLKSFYNIIDLLVLVGFVPILVLVLVDSSKQPERLPNTAIMIYLTLLSLRGMSQLRVVDSVRYLVAMIERVFFDMIPFITVLFFTIGSLAVIETQISKTSEDYEPGYGFFLKKLNQVYEIGYGSWEGTGELPFVNYSVYFFESFLFALVMFNLLIAIISKTFEVFEEEKELKDVQELFEIFMDISAFVRFFSGLGCAKKHREEYLHVITCDRGVDNKLDDITHRLDGKFLRLIQTSKGMGKLE